MNKKNLIPILTGLSIVLSIIAICTSLRCFSIGETAYLGWVVAVLSMLVVVLISWQIFSLIEVKDIVREINEKKKQVLLGCEITSMVTYMALADYYYSVAIGKEQPREEIEFHVIHYRMLALINASSISDFNTCNAIIQALLESVTDNFITSKKKKEILIATIPEVKNRHNIKKYDELISLLCALKTY
ncbi:hypothetical protein EZS27_016962 [termite gut metagenome]|uniref:Uncharacterized protein n=1 Tax=termite gut metagenome TaxID=433724 RepID=A0A5J4RKY7_9ZZZZ